MSPLISGRQAADRKACNRGGTTAKFVLNQGAFFLCATDRRGVARHAVGSKSWNVQCV